jgi:hypothetical protein
MQRRFNHSHPPPPQQYNVENEKNAGGIHRSRNPDNLFFIELINAFGDPQRVSPLATLSHTGFPVNKTIDHLSCASIHDIKMTVKGSSRHHGLTVETKKTRSRKNFSP